MKSPKALRAEILVHQTLRSPIAGVFTKHLGIKSTQIKSLMALGTVGNLSTFYVIPTFLQPFPREWKGAISVTLMGGC